MTNTSIHKQIKLLTKRVVLFLISLSVFLHYTQSISALYLLNIKELENIYGPYYGVDVDKKPITTELIQSTKGKGLDNLKQFVRNEDGYYEDDNSTFHYEEAVDEYTEIYAADGNENLKHMHISSVPINYYDGYEYHPIDTNISIDQPTTGKKLLKTNNSQFTYINNTNILVSKYSLDIENSGILFEHNGIEVYYKPILGNYISSQQIEVINTDGEGNEEITYETVQEETKMVQEDAPWVEGNQIIYPLSNETNIRYTIHNGFIKEDIILNTVGNTNTYSYEISVNNGEVVAKDNAIIILDSNSSASIIIGAPRAYDAAGNETEISISYADGIITYSVDQAWLNDSNRVYPIVIDPYQQVAGHEAYDVSVVERYPYITVGNVDLEAMNWKLNDIFHARMYLGNDYEYKDSYSFYKIIPEKIYNLQGYYIKSAYASFPIYEASSSGTLNACSIKGSHNVENATYNGAGSIINDLDVCSQAPYDPSNRNVVVDITDYVKGVVEEGKPNNGVALFIEDRDSKWLRLYSSKYYNYELAKGWSLSQNYPGTVIEYYATADVPREMELNEFDYKLRPFVKYNYEEGVTHFIALAVDGKAPYKSDVYFTIKDGGSVYDSTVMNAFDNFYQFPKYEPIEDVPSRWTTPESNYQTSKVFKDFEKNKIYDIEVYAKKGTEQSEVKKTWFQLYESNKFDLVSNIASFYGVEVSTIKDDNNLQDELITEGNLLFIREPKKNKGIEYQTEDLSQSEKQQIDAALRGRSLECEFGNEPINFNTGNYVAETEDFSLSIEGEEFHFIRNYNSVSSHNHSTIGYGWTHNMMGYVGISKDGATVLLPNSKKYYFTKETDGTYRSTITDQFKLSNNGDHFNLYDKDEDKTYTFLHTGELSTIVDSNNRMTKLEYNENRSVSKVIFPNGLYFTVEYDDLLVSKIIVNDGTYVTYQYDENDNLIRFTDQTGKSINYQYDDKHRLTSWTNRENETVITNTYDDNNRVVKQIDRLGNTYQTEYRDNQTVNTDPNGNQTIYNFDEHGGTTSIVYADGKKVEKQFVDKLLTREKLENGIEYTYIYNDKRELTKKRRSDGFEENWEYQDGNVVRYTNSEGQNYHFTYDANGYETSRTNSLGNTSYKQYDDNGNLLSETDYNGNTTTYQYNDKNQVIKVSYPDGSYFSYVYDVDGYLANTTDKYGNTTYLNHNERNELVLVTNPDGTTIKYEYDGNGNQTAIENENGHVTRKTYDIYGNVLSIKDPLGNITTQEYDANNNLIKIVNPDGSYVGYTYDERDRTVEKNQNNHIQSYSYNEFGLETITNEKGQVSTNEYDSLGNVTKVIGFDGLVATSEFDKLGRVVKQIDTRGSITSFEYDLEDRLIKQQTPLATTTYMYDANGNLIQQVYESDDSSRTITYEYNSRNLVTKETDALGNETISEYDGERLIAKIDPTGDKTSWSYDSRNRVVVESLSDDKQRQWSYDGVGNKIKEIDTKGNSVQFVYDGNNNLIQTVDALGNPTTYTYDNMNRQISSRSPLGYKESYTYDIDGNILSRSINDRIVDTFTYDSYGNLIEETINGLTTTYEHDEYDNLIKKIEPTGLTHTYTYDKYHRVLSNTINGELAHQYTYNNYDKVISDVDLYGETTTNQYNSDLNLVETNYHNLTQTYVYDLNDRIITQQDSLGNIKEINYDQNGNIISESINGNTTTYEYDTENNVSKKIDSLNRETTFVYNHEGYLEEEIDGNGVKTEYIYDGNHSVIETKKESITVSKNEYDEDGQLIKQIDGEGHYNQFVYDEFRNIIKAIDKRGYATEYSYDEHFNLISVKDAKGNISTNTYNNLNQLIEEKDAKNNAYKYEYDIFGNITKTTSPLGGIETNTYNSKNQLVSTKDTRGLETSFEYDSFNQITKTIKDGVDAEINTYDKYGRLISVENSLNAKKQFQYDSQGNILKITYPNQGVEQFEYDSENQIVKQIDVLGATTEFEYDGVGRTVKSTVESERNTFTEYDYLGNVSAIVDGRGNRTEFTYNTRNELIETKDALGYITKNEYAPTGELILAIDQNGNQTKYILDELGQVVQEIDREGNIVTNMYDEVGNLSSVQNAKGYRINYEYNALGSLVKESNGNEESTYKYNASDDLIETRNHKGQKENYSYDKKGNLISYKQKDGNTIKYTYDTEDNMLSKNSVTFKYDEMNQMIEMSDSSGISTYTYNKAGSLDSVTQKGNTINYEYNSYDELIVITYPDGTKTSYEYDGNGNIKIVSGQGTEVTYEYDGLNREIIQNRSNGVRVIKEYDKVGNVSHISATSNGSSYLDIRYEYNKNDSLVKETKKQMGKQSTTEYTYNQNDELTSSTLTKDGKTTKTEYVITMDGNVSEMKDGKTTTRNEYNELNQITKSVHDGYTFNYVYDENGNRIEEKRSDGKIRSYKWDEFGNLVKVNDFDGSVYEYTYDGLGHRLSMNASKTAVRFETGEYVVEDKMDNVIRRLKLASSSEYGNLCLVAYYNEDEVDPLPINTTWRSTGEYFYAKDGYNYGYHKESYQRQVGYTEKTEIQYINDYTYTNEQVLTEIHDGQTTNYLFGNERIASNKIQYVLDNLESVSLTLNPSGTINTEYEYTDYGVRDIDYDIFNHNSNPIGYTGEYHDPTGLIYLRARYYDPNTFNFISEDPYRGILYDPSSRNRYSYGRNNPKKYIDPSGNFSLKNAWNGFKKTVTKAANKFVNTTKNAVTKVTNTVKSGYNTFKTAVKNTVNNISNAYKAPQTVVNNIRTNVTNTINNIRNNNVVSAYTPSGKIATMSTCGTTVNTNTLNKTTSATKVTYNVGGKSVTTTIAEAEKQAQVVKVGITEAITSITNKIATTISTKIDIPRINIKAEIKALSDKYPIVKGSLANRIKGLCEVSSNKGGNSSNGKVNYKITPVNIKLDVTGEIDNENWWESAKSWVSKVIDAKTNFDIGSTLQFAKGVVITPIIELEGFIEKNLFGSSKYYDSAKDSLSTIEDWVKVNLVTNEAAYKSGQTVGNIAAIIFGLGNLFNGTKNLVNNLQNIKTITINIPSIGKGLGTIGESLTLAPATSYSISIPTIDVLSLAQSGVGVMQISGSGVSNSESVDLANDSNAKIDRAVKNVNSNHKQNYKCEEFAKELSDNLDAEGISYEVIHVKSKYGIYSDNLGESVALGIDSHHYAIKIGDVVYDNNYSNGLSFSDWLIDLGISEENQITYTIIDKTFIP